METVSNLTGQPITATLAGKAHKFRQLTIAELFGKFEAEVAADWTKRMHTLAAGMPLADKIEFMSYQASHPISAEDSARLVRDKMNSADGVRLIISWTHLTEDGTDVLPDVISMMTDPVDQIAVRGLVEALSGTAGLKSEGSKDGPKAQ